MKTRLVFLGFGALLLLFAAAVLFSNANQVEAQDPIAQRLAKLAQLGIKFQTTPPAKPPPAGITLSPSGELTFPRPPVVSDEELDRAARARLEQTPLPTKDTVTCKNDPELFSYVSGRKDALTRVQPFGPRGVYPAIVTFKRPISEIELERFVQDYGLSPSNLHYATNGDSTGVFCYRCDTLAGTESRLRAYGDNRLYVTGYASIEVAAAPQDLKRLNGHPDVLLVDPGTLEEMEPGKYRSKVPEPLFWRYEQACH